MMARPRIWPYIAVFAVGAIAWVIHAMYGHYQYMQTTGLEAPNMGSTVRNGLLTLFAVVIVVYGASFAWMHRASNQAKTVSSPATVAAPSHGSVASNDTQQQAAMLALTGRRFVLEVRGLGVVIGNNINTEIWKKIEAKADNHASILSQDPKDYTDSADIRLSDLTLATGMAFGQAAHGAVERWPVPVIVWGPPKDRSNSFRVAANIAAARQQAGLGVHLFLWERDANTDDGGAMVQRLFDFFDAHPDVPAALVFSLDGSMTRRLLQAPGSGRLENGRVVPALPDSAVAMLVSRSDRVDKSIRPFAVEQTEAVDNDSAQYDVIRLWNLYWEKNDGDGPDDFRAFYKHQAAADGLGDSAKTIGTMQSTWWQRQLPELWKEASNQGPGRFTPTPYVPVRWTNWQLKQFDGAPLLGYVHRPVDIKLTDENGKPLNSAAEVEALKTGWEQALNALPDGERINRVFYDTTGDRQWVAPLSQAFAKAAPSGPSLTNAREGYDIGGRIGNTGVSSPMVQLGLGLIASYSEGGASATVNRSPSGGASIVIVSPPPPAAKTENVARAGDNPFITAQ
jgi:hypothetical protein